MTTNPALPAFNPDEVALLISAVEKSLRDLRQANEKLGGHDEEMISYGTRYALLLEKLNAVAQR